MPNNDMRMIIEMKEDIASIKSILNTMVNTNNIAIEAAQSARSAHYRIDELIKRLEDEAAQSKLGQRWMIGTVLSIIALCITAISLLWKAIT